MTQFAFALTNVSIAIIIRKMLRLQNPPCLLSTKLKLLILLAVLREAQRAYQNPLCAIIQECSFKRNSFRSHLKLCIACYTDYNEMYSVGVPIKKKRREGTRKMKKRERCLAEPPWKKIRKDSMELADECQIGRQTNPVINVGVSFLKVIFTSLEKINRSVIELLTHHSEQ